MGSLAEIWLPVVGYEGIYEVSNLGRVRSFVGGGGKRLDVPRLRKLRNNKRGYTSLSLKRDGKSIVMEVHTLVLTAFVGPRPDRMQCCHRDGTRTNCKLENLRWGTPSENCLEKRIHGTAQCGERGTGVKLKPNEVIEIRRLRQKGLLFKEIAARFGVGVTTVRRIVHRQSWWCLPNETHSEPLLAHSPTEEI